MFLMLVCILSVIAGILTGVTGHAAWQAVLAALGCFVGLNLLYVIWWVLVAAFVDDTKPIEADAAAPIWPTIAASIYCIRMVVICAKMAGRLSRQASPTFSRVVILLFCNAAVTFMDAPVSK